MPSVRDYGFTTTRSRAWSADKNLKIPTHIIVSGELVNKNDIRQLKRVLIPRIRNEGSPPNKRSGSCQEVDRHTLRWYSGGKRLMVRSS